jgi:hypothetical protein
MKNIYRVLEGYGNPTEPNQDNCIQFLDITFTNIEKAIRFAEAHYKQRTTNNPRWQEYWSTVTTEPTLEKAIQQLTKDMKQ